MTRTISDRLLRLSYHSRRVFNKLCYRYVRGDRRPVFFDIDRTKPELRRLDAAYDVIRAELEALLPRTDAIPRYHEVDGAQVQISAGGEASWRTLFLHFYGAGKDFPNRHLAPRTAELVEGIPGVLTAFFSILEPHKQIPAHCGPSYHYLRYHLGLAVPEKAPPTIRVKDRFYTWKERESILFDDSWPHEIENECDEPRAVLIVDIRRPLPWPLDLLSRFCAGLFRIAMTPERWRTTYGLAGLREPALGATDAVP